MGADHPAFTLAGLRKSMSEKPTRPLSANSLRTVAVGGTMGFVKGGSKPSLIAGVGLGASYGLAGM